MTFEWVPRESDDVSSREDCALPRSDVRGMWETTSYVEKNFEGSDAGNLYHVLTADGGDVTASLL